MSDAENAPPLFAPAWWNYFMESYSIGSTFFCIYAGYWGLFWLNDNGEFMSKCFDLGGWRVKAVYDEPISA